MKRAGKFTSPVEKILALVENVRPSGNNWSCRCPAHDDRQNSLSIGEGRDGRALIFCFAGCDVTDVVDALGLELSDLFDHRWTRNRPKGSRRRWA